MHGRLLSSCQSLPAVFSVLLSLSFCSRLMKVERRPHDEAVLKKKRYQRKSKIRTHAGEARKSHVKQV